jgi:hypothetical protein
MWLVSHGLVTPGIRQLLSLSIDAQCELSGLLFRYLNGGLTLPVFAIAYVNSPCVQSLWCCKITLCLSYRITVMVPWLFNKMAHHSISVQKSVLIVMQCFLADWLDRVPITWPQHFSHLTLLGTSVWGFVSDVVYGPLWPAAMYHRGSEGGLIYGAVNVGSIRLIFEYVQGNLRCLYHVLFCL